MVPLLFYIRSIKDERQKEDNGFSRCPVFLRFRIEEQRAGNLLERKVQSRCWSCWMGLGKNLAGSICNFCGEATPVMYTYAIAQGKEDFIDVVWVIWELTSLLADTCETHLRRARPFSFFFSFFRPRSSSEWPTRFSFWRSGERLICRQS